MGVMPKRRKVALAQGVVRYNTGKPCIRGHTADRFSKSGKCVECCLEQTKAWRADNPETYLSSKKISDKKYRNSNPERTKHQNSKAGRKWREANTTKMHEIRAAWEAANPERVRAKTRNRRARIRGAAGSHTAEDVTNTLHAQGGVCALCGASIVDDRTREVDHIIPLSKCGSNGPENIQILCRTCNRQKGAKMPNCQNDNITMEAA